MEEQLDREEQNQSPCPEFSQLRKELEHLYDVKEEMLKQKSRLNWSLKGDRNTSFFHKVVQRRNHRNKICRILWKGSWVSEPNHIKNIFFEHYKNFFNVQDPLRILTLGSLVSKRLSFDDTEWLDRDFTEEEIEWALSQPGREKSHGPDGFNIRCLTKFWPNIKDKVMKCFQRFSSGVSLPKGLNSSFMILIPKVG